MFGLLVDSLMRFPHDVASAADEKKKKRKAENLALLSRMVGQLTSALMYPTFVL